MDVLELTPESIDEHYSAMFDGLELPELEVRLKSATSDNTSRVLLGKAMLKMNLPINSGLHKVLKEEASEFLDQHPVNEVMTTVPRLNKAGEKEMHKVYTYYPIGDNTLEFKGKDATEADFVQYMTLEAEDANMTPAEIISKYNVASEVFVTKNAYHALHISDLELNLRRAKVAVAMKAMKVAKIQEAMAKLKRKKVAELAAMSSKWLTAEGVKNIFG